STKMRSRVFTLEFSFAFDDGAADSTDPTVPAHENTKGRIVNSAVRRACVMGHPIAHSRSPKIHGYWLEQLGIPGKYELVDRAPEAFGEFFTHLAANGYVGGNITVPH